jgi:hypothetical protein
MKKLFRSYFFVTGALLLLMNNVIAQTVMTTSAKNKSLWHTNNPFKNDVFIENLGQFDKWADTPSPIIYAVNSSDKIFFTRQGLTFMLIKHDAGRGEDKEMNLQEKEGSRSKAEIYYVHLNWAGSNANPDIEVSEASEGYYTFGEKGFEKIKAKGFRKLVYKNLYPGIDVEYSIPEKGGIKYSLILHPGADIDAVKMIYSGDVNEIMKDAAGNILIETPAGTITDHAPVSSLDHTGVVLPSSFILKYHSVSFHVQTANNKGQTVIIDPWTITPTSLTTDNAAYDIDHDNGGNVYVSGGTVPYKLAKYSSSGAWLWTFTNPAGWGYLSGPFYSKFHTLAATGTTFVGEGWNTSGPRIMKINTGGTLDFTSPNFPGNSEMWVMQYNRCSGKILSFGGGASSTLANVNIISDTNLTNNTVFNFNGATGVCCNDIADAELDFNGDFYAYVTSQNNGSSIQNHIMKSLASANYLPPCAFDAVSGYNFNECSNDGIPGFQGGCSAGTVRANALALNNDFLFSYDGQTIKAWDKTNGSLLGSVIVNGSYAAGYHRQHEGIDVDECNNVYAGGTNMVHVYSFTGSTFIQHTPITTGISDQVYDVKLDALNGNLYVSGLGFITVSTQTTACTTGQIPMTVITDSCMGNACVSVTGGTPPYLYQWSNGSTTNCISGAAPGAIYTVTVTDNSCIPLIQTGMAAFPPAPLVSITPDPVTIYYGDSVTLTASGASAYNWSPAYGLNTTTGNAVIAAPLNTTTYTVTGSLNGCTSQATVTVTVLPNLSVSISGTAMICLDHCTGTATAMATGGIPPYTYAWSTTPTQATQTINNLCAGTYTVTVSDSLGHTSSANVSIALTPYLTYSISSSYATCPSCCDACITLNIAGGCPPYSSTWSPNDPNVPAPCSACAGITYTVVITDSCGCIRQATITPDTLLISGGVTDHTAQNPFVYQVREGALVFSEPISGLSIYDLVGRLCFSSSDTEITRAILPPLKTGIYIMKAQTKTGRTLTVKICIGV